MVFGPRACSAGILFVWNFMKPLYVANDTHIGVIRGGTTPFTSYKLRQEVLQGFGNLLDKCKGGNVLLNGDIFDSSNVLFADLWGATEACSKFLAADPTATMTAILGNHDLMRNTANMSSFGLFCKILESSFGSRFISVCEPAAMPEYNAYIIPHLLNQDRFNEALKDVPACSYLFLHCNYSNKFAVQSDASLNLSEDQARACKAERIIIAHEHHARTALRGKVVITGNQLVTAVADCLLETEKSMLRITLAEGIERIPVWQAEGDFDQQDWRSLKDTGARFIRVTGNATAAEASEVVSAISRFRSKSEALVITNATTIEGYEDQEELALNAENITSFDVKSALMELLSEDERVVVERLLNPLLVDVKETENV